MKAIDTKALPAWNLGDLFAGMDDPKLHKTLKRAAADTRRFVASYKGKLRKKITSPGALLKALREYDALSCNASKPAQYAQLVYSESASDPARGAFMQSMRTKYTEISNQLLFFSIELLQEFSTQQFQRWIASKELAPFANYLRKLEKFRKHRLSEAQEILISDRDLTGKAAFHRLFTEEHAAASYQLKLGKSKPKALTQTEILNYLYSAKRDERKAAAEAFSAGLQGQARRMAYIFNVLLQDKAVLDRYRKFAAPESSRHMANEIDQSTVDTMTAVVTENYTHVQKYYRFKREFLGVKELYDYDRYAPVGKSTLRFSYADARRHVIAAFARLSPEYSEIADLFFSKNWIDAKSRPGKRGGAFCSFVTPDLHPYVFMNYNGTLRDVFTLAHELGHAVHAYLMRGQPYANYDIPLTVAETASVFSEMLLFEHMRENLSGKQTGAELFSLYAGKIEGVFSTVFRQVSMYRFEQDFHEARKAGELGIDQINAIWRGRQQEMFGRSLKLTPGYSYWWAYIPHFIHTPFYVYAYAFGELLTLALYARYKRTGPAFTGKYLSMLRAGASQSPDELLRPLRINLRQKSFWQEGAAIIADMVRDTVRAAP